MRMVRLIAAVLCVSLLCACSPDSGTEIPTVPLTVVRTLRLELGSKLPASALEQADAFAAQVEKLSDGMLRIEVTTGQGEPDAVKNGGADLVITRNLQLSQTDELFSMFSMPFFYDSPGHMSAALNSEKMLKILTERLSSEKLQPLAAIYNGSSFLATDNHELRKPSDFKDLVIAMRTDNAVKLEIFESLGARVLPYTQTSVAPLLGTEVEAISEDVRMPSDIVRVDTVELTLDQALQLLREPNALYVVKSYHTIAPLWVLGGSDSLSLLSEQESAVLKEGLAGLVAGLELSKNEEETLLFRQIEEQGIALVDLQRTRSTVANWLYGVKGTGTDRYTPPEFFDPRIYKIIQDFA